MGLSEQFFWRLTPAKFHVLFGRIEHKYKGREAELKLLDAWFARQAALAQEAISVQCRTKDNPMPLKQEVEFLLLPHSKSVGPTVKPVNAYDLEAERAMWKGWVLSKHVRNERKKR